MNFFKALFASDTDNSIVVGALGAALVEELEGYAEQDQKFIVCLAGLLSSVAHRDFEVCESEVAAIEALLDQHTELSTELAKRVTSITLAHGKALAGVDDYKYLRILNEIISESDRQDVVRILFRVAIANDDVSAEEEHHIGLIARDLKVSRQTFIELRNEFAEFRAILSTNK